MWKFLWVLFSWVWKENFSLGQTYVESLLNEFMEMKDFWVDWDIVRMSWNLNSWNGILGLANFLGALFYWLGFWNMGFCEYHNDWLNFFFFCRISRAKVVFSC